MITAERLERSATAILGAAEPEDQFGVSICLNAARNAHTRGDQEVTGAMLDEAAARAGIISPGKLDKLHSARLAGAR